jgi:hypothetical protein
MTMCSDAHMFATKVKFMVAANTLRLPTAAVEKHQILKVPSVCGPLARATVAAIREDIPAAPYEIALREKGSDTIDAIVDDVDTVPERNHDGDNLIVARKTHLFRAANPQPATGASPIWISQPGRC